MSIESTAPKQCNGDGECLLQSEEMDQYERDPAYTCELKCLPIKCPNYELCGVRNPLRELYCHGGRCINCDINYGDNFSFVSVTDQECPVCLENVQKMVQLLKCNHRLCVPCTKTIYFSQDEESEKSEKCPLCRHKIIPKWMAKNTSNNAIRPN